MSVSVGVHDILYDAPAKHRLSIFANFSHYYQINEQYNLEVVKKFAFMAIIWGLIGMSIGVYIASELAWPSVSGYRSGS